MLKKLDYAFEVFLEVRKVCALLETMEYEESSEGDGIVLKKRKRSPLTLDFYR